MKNILITGASSGIGEATAIKLASQGHKVILMARRVDKLETLKSKIDSAGGKALVAVGDVTDFDAMKTTVDELNSKLGSIDVLVNNAGLMPLSFLRNGKVDEAHRMVDVNIKGVINMIYATLPIFLAQNAGHVINISSTAGRNVFPASAIYSGTKFAVRAISDGLRQEVAKDGKDIRVTDIQPGATESELTLTITDQEVLDMFARGPEIEMLKAVDIANAIAYAIEQPRHVNVNEMLIRSPSQAF